jgi:rhodanese-related sulfurtransferase
MNKSISVNDAINKYNSRVPVVDVRTPAEYRSMRVKGAINMPLNEISADKIKSKFGDNEVLIICQAGVRGSNACEIINKQGFEKAINIEGGTTAWVNANFPTEKDSNSCSVISVDRQVRIIAGSLVVLGIVASILSGNSNWQFLSLFIGAGLVFAGVTNTCGMAYFLAKMPWNK